MAIVQRTDFKKFNLYKCFSLKVRIYFDLLFHSLISKLPHCKYPQGSEKIKEFNKGNEQDFEEDLLMNLCFSFQLDLICLTPRVPIMLFDLVPL